MNLERQVTAAAFSGQAPDPLGRSQRSAAEQRHDERNALQIPPDFLSNFKTGKGGK